MIFHFAYLVSQIEVFYFFKKLLCLIFKNIILINLEIFFVLYR